MHYLSQFCQQPAVYRFVIHNHMRTSATFSQNIGSFINNMVTIVKQVSSFPGTVASTDSLIRNILSTVYFFSYRLQHPNNTHHQHAVHTHTVQDTYNRLTDSGVPSHKSTAIPLDQEQGNNSQQTCHTPREKQEWSYVLQIQKKKHF